MSAADGEGVDGRPVRTHCPYCSLQCGITLSAAPGSPVQLAPQDDFPTNRGGLCSKGWTAAELLDHPDRLVQPLARHRRGAPLHPTTWDDALDRVTQAIHRSQQCYGRDSVGCFGGGGLTNEKAYQLGKFARVALGTSQIDYNGRFCMSSAAAATTRAFGIDRGLPFPLADIAAAEVILLVGANPADTMPPAMQWFDEGRSRGATHIVVDPRRSSTARGSKLHLQPVPGTDLALANGLLHLAIKHGHLDTAYIAGRTVGFEQVRRVVRAYWPDRVERITGVPVAQLDEAARLLGEAETAMVITARGAEQHSNGTDTTLAFINLALALGLPGRPGCGFATLTGQGNGQGGREHGQKASTVPAVAEGDPMHTTSRFLQGSYPFEGQGLCKPVPIDPSLTYTVPPGTTAQALYFRGGNSTDEMITVLLMKDGKPMRYFPIGARDGTHVPLRVVEDLISYTEIELHIAAPEGATGTVVVDLGLVEV